MNDLILALDLDDTLINTAFIKSQIFQRLRAYGFGDSAVRKAYRSTNSVGFFSLEMLVRSLSTPAVKISRQKILDGLHSLFRSREKYNFKGVKGFLKGLKDKHNLILLTYGEKRFQSEKLKQSNLKEYFQKVIFSTQPDKRKAIGRLWKTYRSRLVIIDNSFVVCRAAKKIGCKCLRVKNLKGGQLDYNKLEVRVNALSLG